MLGAGTMFSNWASRRARGTRPLAIAPISRAQAQDQQIIQLRRLVARNTPQTSNWSTSKTNITTPAAIGYTSTDYSLTNLFIASTDYSSSVLGDFYRNKALYLTVDSNQDIQKIRVCVYWSKKAGNSYQPSDLNSIPDPAAFQVIHDSMIFPANVTSARRIKINLKNKLTNYNQSSSTLEYGDLHVMFTIYNHTAASRGISWQARLFLQNK